jgi:DNA-binding transcriptional LysR family regulator
MHEMESVDANLVLALDALFEAGSVTGAARRRNVSPPAMSHTLSRLRLVVGDPLFVGFGHSGNGNSTAYLFLNRSF